MTSTSGQPPRSDSPKVGELLPRGAEAFGERYRLETYSLDVITSWEIRDTGAPPRLVTAFPTS